MNSPDDSTPHPRPKVNGRQLNIEWQIGAEVAYYHAKGTWYNLLAKFPAALCDENGYVKFDSISEIRNQNGIKIGSNIWVQNGISNLPGYIRKRG
jgi:hypothetical protein